MRRSLLTAVAAAPLVLMWAGSAMAATTISDAHTTPVSTSTANNGAADDVSITGSVTVTGPVAVTVDSNNTLTSSGTISIKDVDNSTGVLVLGGHAGTVTNTGTIAVTESYTATDTNSDGVVDGPFAKGTGRYGVRVTGASPYTGTLSNANGTITVQGNNSYGISVEAPLVGDLLSTGTISVTGDNTVGLRETASVSGKVEIDGAVNASGAGSVGVDLSGNVGGAFKVYTTVGSTGYRLTSRSVDPTVNAKLLPEDLLQSGSAVSIRADVAHGVFIGAPPAGTVATDATTDADGDGVVDSVEGTGTITTYGSAPALSIGAAGRDVHLGVFGAGDNAYGLISRGIVTGNGQFDNNAGAGLQIGTGDGTVHIDGGARIVGSVSAQSYEADATAIHVRSGAQTPVIRNEGVIQAATVSAKASASTGILLDVGAVVTSLTNAGTITGTLTGDLGSASAVVDKSGSLSTIVNTKQIGAQITPAAVGDAVAGQAIALDLRANTTGVSFTQNANPASTTAAPITPVIAGDILLGSGADNVQIHAGSVAGALDFGAGQGVFVVDGGASYTGKLQSSGSISLTVASGVLQDENPATINATSLTIGATGALVVTADPAHNTHTLFNVSGAADIAAGGQLGLHLASLPTGPLSFVAISSPHLTSGAVDSALIGQSPYLFITGVHADTAAGTVTVNLRRRTAAEAGLNLAESQSFDGVYNNLGPDAGIQQGFLSQTTQAGLTRMLDQMTPDYAGGVFRALTWASEAQADAAGQGAVGQDQSGPTRGWTQEIVLHEKKDRAQAAGYNILGFGIIGGVESVSAKGDALGVKLGFITADIRDPSLPSDNLDGISEFNTGVYWRGSFGAVRADAQLGAGYMWADNRREFLYSDSAGVVHRTAKGRWNGYTVSARAGLAYTAQMGAFFVEPRVHVDYFRSHEGGYTETGGGTGFDLSVDPRSGDVLSVTSSVIAGATFGEGFHWRPQVEVGYRGVLSGSAGLTTAQFAGGAPFSLAAESLRASSLIGRVGLRIYSDYVDLLLDAGGQFNTDYTDIDVRLTARTVF